MNNQLIAYLAKCVTLSETQEKIQEQNKRMPEGHMQIRPELAHFLSFLLRLTKPKRILELGTYTGFSALTFAEATEPTCQIVAVDRNQEWTKLAKRFWSEAGVSDRIQLIYGDAPTVLQQLISDSIEPFDFIFIDASKKHYERYVNFCLELLAPGGFIAVDNVLWGGEVLNPKSTDLNAYYIAAFNEVMFARTDITVSIVPLDDGVMLIQKYSST
ncbi:MAG: O-methyltransferase [Alphaproteobacteria bacterium]|nr:O-methyltransferase [Alphaproteobacteria bacterium]